MPNAQCPIEGKGLPIAHCSLLICHWLPRRYLALAFLLVIAVATSGAPAGTNNSLGSGPQTIGIEGHAVLDLPAPNYQPKPLDDRTELILRIEKIEPLEKGRARYFFHFIGLEPGSYSLANYLIRPDGSQPDEIGETQLQVQALLPDDHDGQLNAHVPRPFPFIGGYRALLVTLAILWIGGIAAFAWFGRKRKVQVVVTAAAPQPTFAERLQPLVEAAATGQLSTEGQANLERLLMGYWRERLSLPEMRMAEALSRLKAHTEAGAILRAVERWLHHPGGVGMSEIKTLLQPYRHLPAPAGAGIGGINVEGSRA